MDITIKKSDWNRGPALFRVYMDGSGNVVKAETIDGEQITDKHYHREEKRRIENACVARSIKNTPKNCTWRVVGGVLK